jgi:hypothetical protein
MGEFSKDDRLELVYADGRPSYFKEKPRERDGLGISEATASYLQEAKPLNASGYLSGAHTPAMASPDTAPRSDASVLSLRVTAEGSVATTPETQSPPSLASSGLEVDLEDRLSSAALSEETRGVTSIPYGKRLIPQIMDSLAAAEPERVVFSLTTPSGDSLEFRHITAHAFTKAVDRTAWWLHNQVGKPDCIQPVGYIGPRKL